MGTAPSFQFYARDFYASTSHMTAAEVGVYIRALAWSWDNGALPTSPDRLARVVMVTAAELRKIWPKISEKFIKVENGFRNSRLEDVRARAEAYRLLCAKNGAKGGRPKAEPNPSLTQGLSHGIPKANPRPNPEESSPSPISDLHKDQDQGLSRKERARAFDADFELFWKRYPKKIAKAKAFKVWQSTHPPITLVLDAISWQVNQPKWVKDGGEFIPHPSSWLNQRRWEDEPFNYSEPDDPNEAVWERVNAKLLGKMKGAS